MPSAVKSPPLRGRVYEAPVIALEVLEIPLPLRGRVRVGVKFLASDTPPNCVTPTGIEGFTGLEILKIPKSCKS